MGALALPDPRSLLRDIAAYAKPQTGRSLLELAVTAIPFLLLLTAMWVAVGAGYWIALLLAVPAGVMLVRLFMIQHDCGHGSFFPRRAANDWLGRVLGVFTLTPYDYFKRSHAMHHARTGNLDHRGIGDVATLTVREYQEKSRWGRLVYRLYRNPIILFGIGPAYLFILQYRLPVGLMRSGWRPWLSTMATNVALVAFIALAIWALGAAQFLLVYVPVLIVASTIGVWLFYVQHQFDGAHWDRDENWSFHEAALHGSSHYDLPGVLRWLTANIGIHHIHHLSSRIPFYRLDSVLRDRPELRAVSRLTLRESLRTVTLALWDEDQRRLVTFRQAKALRTGQPAAA
jgi:omega-6 fatty acid desaturase (delta-12 desaturase)